MAGHPQRCGWVGGKSLASGPQQSWRAASPAEDRMGDRVQQQRLDLIPGLAGA